MRKNVCLVSKKVCSDSSTGGGRDKEQSPSLIYAVVKIAEGQESVAGVVFDALLCGARSFTRRALRFWGIGKKGRDRELHLSGIIREGQTFDEGLGNTFAYETDGSRTPAMDLGEQCRDAGHQLGWG